MPRAADPPAGSRLALVVATTTYTDVRLRALRAPAQDAADLAQVLANPDIGGFTVTTVIDQPAQQVRLAVEDFLVGRGTGDLLLVYLSCHGLLDDYRRLYFAATDTRKDRLGSTGVESAWVLDQLEHCRARRQVLILDCCFSGAFANGAKGETDLGLRDRFLSEGHGRVVLTASTATEYSFEGKPADPAVPPGSVFTAALAHGLYTGDADTDRDGYVSVDDAYAYVFDQVQAVGAAQTPQRWLYGAKGQILLARNPAGPAPPPTPAPVPVGPSHLARTLTGHTGGVLSVAFSPDGLLLATTSGDGTTRVWDPATGDCLRTLTRYTETVWGVAFSPDGLLATVSDDKTARIWDPATGDCSQTLTGHTGPVLGVAFSPDGRLLATASHDKTARIWDPATGDCLLGYTGARTGSLRPGPSAVPVWDVAFSPDGRLLATVGDYGRAWVWDSATGNRLRTFTGHVGAVVGVAFSPDGRLLATASHDETVRVWDPGTGDCVRTLTGHTERVMGVAFSPDGRLLATASIDKTARIWDPATSDCLQTLTGHAGPVWGVAFSPDGRLLATASIDKTVRLWN